MEFGPAEAIRLASKNPSMEGLGHYPIIPQPKVQLVDAGGNIVTNDSETEVIVTLVQSLSQNSNIVIDTSNDPLPEMVSVRFHQSVLEDGFESYSSGHVLVMVITFTQEVFVHRNFTLDGAGGATPLVPTLEMDLGANNTLPLPQFLDNHAFLSNFTIEVPSKELYFTFTVPESCKMAFPLKLAANASIQYNDYWISDGWNRMVPLDIPKELLSGLESSKALGVTSDPAVITQIVGTTGSGVFGAGHVIKLNVNFTRKVNSHKLSL